MKFGMHFTFSITRPVLTLSLTSLTPTCKTAYCMFSDAGQSSTVFLAVALVLALCNWALWRPMKRSFVTYLVMESPIKRASASLSCSWGWLSVLVDQWVRQWRRRWLSVPPLAVVCLVWADGLVRPVGQPYERAVRSHCPPAGGQLEVGYLLSASLDGCPLARCCNNVPWGILSCTLAGDGLGAFGIPKPSIPACGDNEAGSQGLRLVAALSNERSLAVKEHSTLSTLFPYLHVWSQGSLPMMGAIWYPDAWALYITRYRRVLIRSPFSRAPD